MSPTFFERLIMSDNTTRLPATPPVFIFPHEREAFWRHYNEWVCNATNEELEQLQTALESYGPLDGIALHQVIYVALTVTSEKRKFPASLLAPLIETNWLGVAAIG